jgi:hypothetical protein
MKAKPLLQTKTLPAIAALSAGASPGADQPPPADFLARMKSKDDAVRGPAWQGAAPLGAPALEPLAGLAGDADSEIARAARRAMWKIIRYAGRPGAAAERAAVETALLALLKSGSAPVRREVVWMLSEVGTDTAVGPLAGLLSDPDLRDDARAALERIPGPACLAALRSALVAAPADFQPALADSLRARGEKVASPPSRKLVPAKQTTVK